MANYKIVISDPKSKKAFQKEIEQKASGFLNKRIGDKVKGDGLGLTGYEFQVTGGSDAQGFPMRKDVEGPGRKKVLLSRGTGFNTQVRGLRKRKSVRGNTISSATSQINVKISTYGSKPMEELAGKPEKKKELTEEEKKKALHEELSGKVEDKAPEKSRSDQIREEMETKEKAAEGSKTDTVKEEKPEEPKKAENKDDKAEAKPDKESSEKDKPKEDSAKKDNPKVTGKKKD